MVWRTANTLLASAAALACLSVLAGAMQQDGSAVSQWVHTGPGGKLIYKTTPAGDRIMDFSSAGYRGGGVALPNVPVKATVLPSGGQDDTGAIQAAIDRVAAMDPVNGFRGAVLLAPGTFTCSRTISIPASGVVLRGSGPTGTTIRMTGAKHSAFSIARSGNAGRAAGSSHATSITDAYVPAGASAFTVADASGLASGDQILIRHPITPAWIEFMQMHNLGRTGQHQTWIDLSRNDSLRRTITAISGHRITVDVPLSDSFDARYLNPPGTTVSKAPPREVLTQIGIEDMRIACPPLEIAYGKAPYSVARLACDDCWVKDVQADETMNSFTLAGDRITMERVTVNHTFPNLGASKPTDFSIEGSQNLIDRCQITGDNMYFVWTGSVINGPNVVLNSTFRGRGSRIQPHQRWSTGLLVDNCTVPDGGIDFPNRGVAGSGHGWTMGWGVVWNSVAAFYVVQNPPGVQNWVIGSAGRRERTARYFDRAPILPEGVFDSYGAPVTPQSLYLAQLAERKGPAALRNIGYASNTASMFPNKSVARLPEWLDMDPVLGRNLAFHRPVDPSNVRDGACEFGAEKALDGDNKTYWATDDSVTHASMEVDTEGPVDVNTVVISEASGFNGRVQAYKVEGMVDSEYVLLSQGTSIGERKVDRFPTATVWKLRLTILESQGYPALSTFAAFLAH
jgi:hypothetical protein